MTEAHGRMLNRLKKVLSIEAVRARVAQDFLSVLVAVGFTQSSDGLIEEIFRLLKGAEDLHRTEMFIGSNLLMERYRAQTGQGLLEQLNRKTADRADIIYRQIAPYFGERVDRLIDYGCGDGKVTLRLVYGAHATAVIGYDVTDYMDSESRVTIRRFDGRRVPELDGSFDAGLMTNVLHHAEQNQLVIDDVRRLLRPGAKLVVIETCPEKDTPEEFEVTFLNDYIYNRLLHPDDDIPVPGTFETAEGWTRRFEKSGFKQVSMRVLGYDQPLIRDWHVLYELERV